MYLLRQLIREYLSSEYSPEEIEKLYKSFSSSPHDPHEYTNDKEYTQLRRSVKRKWNQVADPKLWNDPGKVTIIHSPGYYAGGKSLFGYFDLRNLLEKAILEAKLVNEEDLIGAEHSASWKKFIIDLCKENQEEITKILSTKRIPGISSPGKDELSCFGFLNKKSEDSSVTQIKKEGFLTFKKYRITMVSEWDMATEWLSKASSETKKKYSQSGLPKRPGFDRSNAFLTGQKNWLSAIPTHPEEGKGIFAEVIIDNWLADGFYSPDSDEIFLAKLLGLKILSP